MKFIMLTSLKGNKVVINTDYIIQVGFDDGVNMGKGATFVLIKQNEVMYVKEKVEEVYKRINDIVEVQNKADE